MKLKIGETVYLQKYEVAHIVHESNVIPKSVLDEILSCNAFFFINSSEDNYKFACAFNAPDSVRWLMEQDWIVDYDEYAGMPTPELQVLVEQLMLEHATEVDEFNNSGKVYRKINYDKANEQFGRTAHKIMSLRDIIAARDGKIVFVFPEDYKVRPITRNPETNVSPKEKAGFFTKLFGHGAQ